MFTSRAPMTLETSRSSMPTPWLRPQRETAASKRSARMVVRASEEEGPSGFPASDMAVLAKRLKELKQKSVEKTLQTSLNWRQGQCSHIVVARIDDWVRKIKFHGDLLCLGTHGGLVMLADLSRKGAIVAVLRGLTGEVTALDFDGRRVMAGTVDGGVGLWTVQEGGEWAGGSLESFGDTCTGVHLAGTSTATGVSLKGSVRVWEGSESAELVELNEAVSVLHFSDGYAFAGLRDGRLMVYSASEGRLKTPGKGAPVKPILEFEAHNGEITCVQFLKGSPGPDGAGDMIVTGSFDGSLRSWDLEGSKLVHTFKGHTSAVSCLQADSEKLVSGARDGIIRVWSMSNGSHQFCITGHTRYLDALQFDGPRLIASGTNNVVVLHDFGGAGA